MPMICSSVNRPFFISESPFVASSYCADLKILNFNWSKLLRAGQMDIEFTVDVEAGGAPPNPRMENTEYLMASGISGSVDDAFRGATTNLVRWLEKMYGLNTAEVSSVLGTSIVYDIAEVVDPQPHVVAKVPRSVLVGLKKAPVH